MPRRVLIESPDGTRPILIEQAADSEAQLQELVKTNPDLLPLEEFGMVGPLLVIGKETSLPSGAVDLVGLARSGEILIIEFKTGPQNPDFRRATAQLIDYGSAIAGKSFDEFEKLVPRRYFSSAYCTDERVKGLATLHAAAKAVWEDLGDEEWAGLRDQIAKQLKDGTFHYVLAAQRFTPTIETSLAYLNQVSTPRFYGVELVRFTGESFTAFEARTVVKPSAIASQSNQQHLDRAQLLDSIEDAAYRDFVEELLTFASALGCTVYFGIVGVSIRVPNLDRPTPVTVLWLYPPGAIGWMGLTALTVGYDSASAEKLLLSRAALEAYARAVADVGGAVKAGSDWLDAYGFTPDAARHAQREIFDLLERVREELQG